MVLFDANGALIIALGKTLMHSLWIGLLILALLRTVLHAIPGKHAHLRYLLSVASMLVLAGSVTATFFLLYAPGNPAGIHFRMLGSLKVGPQIMVPESSSGPAWTTNLLFLFCSYCYFAGLAYMLIRSTISYGYIRGLRKSGIPVHGEWKDRLERISHILGIRRKLSFLQSDRIQGPLLLGILKPAVLVPVGMFTHLSVSQVESVLIHELYHLKRGDALINLMQLFLEGVFFYNPALWFISDIIRREREHSCDDAVVLTSKDPVNYAKALVSLAEKQQYIRLAPGAGGSKKHHFTARITRIINKNPMKNNKQERLQSLLLFAGALILVLAISGFSSGFSFSDRMDSLPDESLKALAQLPPVGVIPPQDTIREPGKPEIPKDPEELDWDQIKEEMEAARAEAIEELDWDQIKAEMEAARAEAIEELDWDQIKAEMEAARAEAIEELDWDQIKAEMDSVIRDLDMDVDMDFDVDIDMESIREDMEQVRREMKEIDWEEMKEEIERNLSDMKIDVEEVKKDIEESLKDVDWEEMRKEMENTRPERDTQHREKDI
jgi:bla regulator protein BlaR1